MNLAPASTQAAHRLQELREADPRSSAEQRREQLIKIAAYIVEFEGLDALKHARIAEHAGCARPLVYKYFPRKSDIYIAVCEAFYERLSQQFSCEDQYRAVQEALQGDPSMGQAMESLIWDVLDEFGCAGLILRCMPEINEAFLDFHRELGRRYEYRWLLYFQELGLDEQRSALLLDNCISVVTNIGKAYCAGLLDREQSLNMVLRSLGALVRAELKVKPTHSSN